MITITMAKHFLFSLCFLLFTSACLAHHSELDRFNQCQLDSINALEPDHRVESEAGLTETWNPNHPELQCAGVSLIRRTIDPNGLHLPSYSPSPQLIFIIQGKGVLGLAVPGCPETYEEPRSQSRQKQQQRDSHQKIRRFSKGDVIAIPPGIPYWTYNHGDEPLVAISLLDISNTLNQLDSTPRVFYLGGNPEAEFPETQEQERPRRVVPFGRRGGQNQKQEESEEQNEGNSVLSGFGAEFLAQSLNTNEHTAKRLRSPRDKRGQIVKVEDGLDIISPELQEEEQQQSHSQREEEEAHGKRSEKEEEDEEDEPLIHEIIKKWKKETEEKKRESRGQGEEKEQVEEEEKEEEEEVHREHSKGSKNGLEETICTTRIRENIARPSRADLYNPRAGRISTVNSLTLPILRNLRLSAEYVLLYRNGIYAPHWNINANSLLYVIRGQGRVRIVNSQGNPVFDDKVRKGQLVVVPQNFVVAEQAGDEEAFEYVVFKTNDRAAVSHVKQVFRATPAEVLANAFGLRKSEAAQIKYNGNRGSLVQPQSQ
ncbi:legumin J-like [Vicia villosa]|uniref:legumin J-like n=1 Tax=Vicia villosa TaxID=3911 RepID=UPI00273B6623|nr:legumin J-like [Vicia villosa]